MLDVDVSKIVRVQTRFETYTTTEGSVTLDEARFLTTDEFGSPRLVSPPNLQVLTWIENEARIIVPTDEIESLSFVE